MTISDKCNNACGDSSENIDFASDQETGDNTPNVECSFWKRGFRCGDTLAVTYAALNALFQDLYQRVCNVVYPPTGGVTVPAGQDPTAVTANLTYTANPNCASPGIVSAAWVLKDSGGNTIQSGTDVPPDVTFSDLTGEANPFTIEYTVTDSCGTSPTLTAGFDVFIEGVVTPTASVDVASGQDPASVTGKITYTAHDDCATPGITSHVWELYDGTDALIDTGLSLTFISDIADITLMDLTGLTGAFRLESTVTDACGTSTTGFATFTTTDSIDIPCEPWQEAADAIGAVQTGVDATCNSNNIYFDGGVTAGDGYGNNNPSNLTVFGADTATYGVAFENRQFSLHHSWASKAFSIGATYADSYDLASRSDLVFTEDGGTEWMRIVGLTGYVGIGTPTPTATLSVNGTADKVGGGVWGTFSDKRGKKNIRNYEKGLDEILQYNPVAFKYKAEMGFGKKTYVSLIADDVLAISPEMVESSASFEKPYNVDADAMPVKETDEDRKKPRAKFDEFKKLDTSDITYQLINAVKTLNARIETLEAAISGGDV